MSNKLDHLDEFKEVLADYKVSEAGQNILKTTNLAIFVGPTSAGRNTLINKLLRTGEYHYIISDTTRSPRENDGVMEQNGVEYWFKSEEEVLGGLKSGEYLEAAIIHGQQVSGMSLRELEKARDEGKVAINEIEVTGADNVMKIKPDTNAFFVVPPNFAVWMDRLKKRGKLPESEIKRRLESAVKEYTAALERSYYIFVINDNLDDALAQIHKHAILNESDPEHDALGRRVTERLLEDTQNFLKKN